MQECTSAEEAPEADCRLIVCAVRVLFVYMLKESNKCVVRSLQFRTPRRLTSTIQRTGAWDVHRYFHACTGREGNATASRAQHKDRFQ
eukprot:3665338-Amphidinium_carterae.1